MKTCGAVFALGLCVLAGCATNPRQVTVSSSIAEDAPLAFFPLHAKKLINGTANADTLMLSDRPHLIPYDLADSLNRLVCAELGQHVKTASFDSRCAGAVEITDAEGMPVSLRLNDGAPFNMLLPKKEFLMKRRINTRYLLLVDSLRYSVSISKVHGSAGPTMGFGPGGAITWTGGAGAAVDAQVLSWNWNYMIYDYSADKPVAYGKDSFELPAEAVNNHETMSPWQISFDAFTNVVLRPTPFYLWWKEEDKP